MHGICLNYNEIFNSDNLLHQAICRYVEAKSPKIGARLRNNDGIVYVEQHEIEEINSAIKAIKECLDIPIQYQKKYVFQDELDYILDDYARTNESAYNDIRDTIDEAYPDLQFNHISASRIIRVLNDANCLDLSISDDQLDASYTLKDDVLEQARDAILAELKAIEESLKKDYLAK